MKNLFIAFGLFLAGCGGQVAESNESAIANQAESLERAADATTDQMIKEIEESARAEEPGATETPATAVSNESRP